MTQGNKVPGGFKVLSSANIQEEQHILDFPWAQCNHDSLFKQEEKAKQRTRQMDSMKKTIAAAEHG